MTAEAGLAQRLAAAGALLAALLAAAACETRAQGSHFAEQIRDSVQEKLGPVERITCPERILIENQKTVFDCDVELASGVSRPLEVTLDREGQLGWHTK